MVKASGPLLFDPPALPEGFRHADEFLDRDEERTLTERFRALDFHEVRMRGLRTVPRASASVSSGGALIGGGDALGRFSITALGIAVHSIFMRLPLVRRAKEHRDG